MILGVLGGLVRKCSDENAGIVSFWCGFAVHTPPPPLFFAVLIFRLLPQLSLDKENVCGMMRV